MKEKTFYGSSSHRGEILGNYVVGKVAFNSIIFDVYVPHRVAQRTKVIVTNRVHWIGESEGSYTDVYSYRVDTRNLSDEVEAFEELNKAIVSISKYVDMRSYDSKITEELLRVLG